MFSRGRRPAVLGEVLRFIFQNQKKGFEHVIGRHYRQSSLGN
jgi:hypothetical protein